MTEICCCSFFIIHTCLCIFLVKISCKNFFQDSLWSRGDVSIVLVRTSPVSSYGCDSCRIEAAAHNDELPRLVLRVHVEWRLHTNKQTNKKVKTGWQNVMTIRDVTEDKKSPEQADQQWENAQRRCQRSAGRCSLMGGIYQRSKACDGTVSQKFIHISKQNKGTIFYG